MLALTKHFILFILLVITSVELEAVIFDCDGTLVDSMGAWIPSWKHACSLHGLTITEVCAFICYYAPRSGNYLSRLRVHLRARV